jgi:rSAM/selenodomain-associated transferase 1
MQSQYEILDRTSGTITRAFCALAVMAKAPLAGSVKTRLVPPLQPGEAAALNTCFLRDVTAVMDKVCVAGRVEGFAAYTPTGAESWFDGLLPSGFRLLAQRGANLGERLFHATEDFLAAGYQALCLINSDSPTLPVAVLHEAVVALRAPGDRIVLGPADDGGYYLVGLKRAHRRLFEDIAWSTGSVLASTLDRAREIGLETKLLPPWYDVDDAASLGRLCRELFSAHGHGGAQAGYAAPHTREYLRKLTSCVGESRFAWKFPPEQAAPYD